MRPQKQLLQLVAHRSNQLQPQPSVNAVLFPYDVFLRTMALTFALRAINAFVIR